jgi:hypothetical protein
VDGGAEQQEVGGARGEAGRQSFGARRVGVGRGAARRRRRGRGEWRVERTEASRGAVAPLFFPHFEIDTHFLLTGKGWRGRVLLGSVKQRRERRRHLLFLITVHKNGLALVVAATYWEWPMRRFWMSQFNKNLSRDLKSLQTLWKYGANHLIIVSSIKSLCLD